MSQHKFSIGDLLEENGDHQSVQKTSYRSGGIFDLKAHDLIDVRTEESDHESWTFGGAWR